MKLVAQQTQVNRAQRMEARNTKPQEHWELTPVKVQSTFTYKPQSRLWWVSPLKRV